VAVRGERREIPGLLCAAVALFLALCIVPWWLVGDGGGPGTRNVMGVVGAAVARWGYALFGVGAPLLPALPALGAAAFLARMSRGSAFRWGILTAGYVFLLPIAAALLTPELARYALLPVGAAGWLGLGLAHPLTELIGWPGAAVAVACLALVLPIATVRRNPAAVIWRVMLAFGRVLVGMARRIRLPRLRRPDAAEAAERPLRAPAPALARADAAPAAEEAHAVVAPAAAPSPAKLTAGSRPARQAETIELEDPGQPDAEDRPPITLLDRPPESDPSLSEQELDRLGQILIDTLRTFRVDGHIVGRTTGPVVTQFEVVPAAGIKVNRIAALDADLALALKAASVRIVAPIPGKGAVGVEVPNPEPQVVYLREVLESSAFQRSRGHLPLALGKDLHGRPYVADLAKMPHLLIAGATGSGKSVCINTLITSLIYRHSPKSLRLLMVDPKMVELSMYGDLPHLRHPVVTDPKDAATVLKWAVLEMERRYALLSANGARSLGEFNRRAAEGQPLRRAAIESSIDPALLEYRDGPLPYIVVVVDELADLMMSVQSEIEKPLAQLAQKARAIGIHLIVATQRPSVNVITGLIKANFPCRIAFRVSSKVDSRTILDQNGADALLGNGDMLFLPPGHSDPVRIQGVYLSTEETERIMDWYRQRGEADRELEEDILEVVRAQEEQAEDAAFDEDAADRDPLFRQAAEICIQHQQGSTSLLQRRLRIGYGRAARIIDQLHNAGILGPPDGSKPREVLIGLDALDLLIGPR